MLNWIFVFVLIPTALCAPQELEVWFLSAHKKAQLEQILNEKRSVFYSLTSELKCQEMGDFCFDPQYGLYKKDDSSGEVDISKAIEERAPSIPYAKSVERDFINCDPQNHFDIFCGKSNLKTPNNPKLELWIDTSSSMREMDFTDKDGGCYRKSLVRRLDQTCGFNQRVNVMMFDTSIKQAGTMDALCTNQGLNDMKKMIDWIERSSAKKLVIITDIYELQKDLADYVESKQGKFRGDKELLTAAGLLSLVDDLEKLCR